MFLVDDRMWNVFLQTGNVEAYLLVKQWEQERLDEEVEHEEAEMKID